MAKSLRSKVKRRMRKIQRDKADVIQTAQMVEKFKKIEDEEAESLKKIEETRTELSKDIILPDTTLPVESMEIEKEVKKYDPKKMTDEHGQYPKWMNKRAILKTKKNVKRLKKKHPKK